MPAAHGMPAIDVATCADWSEQDLDLYNSVPFYLAKMETELRKTWTTWAKFTKKRRWKQNQGDTLRGVATNPSPHLRQFANPKPIKQALKKDIMNVRERTSSAQVYGQKFESPPLNFYPSFNDFMDHVDDTGKDIMEKIERYEDIFLRGNIFHMSPYMFISKGDTMELVKTPPWLGTGEFNPATDGKTKALIAANTPNITGHLKLAGLNHAYSIMDTELRVPFFSGSQLPKENAPLDGKYCLVTSNEAYGQFTFDPYVQQHKNCDLDIVNESFKGSFFGKITSKLEDLPLRFQGDGDFPQPEIRVDDDAENGGETVPNPEYAQLNEEGSPYEVSWLVGGIGYESIEVGPPPSAFTGDSPPHNFPAMNWNGKVIITKQKLVPCIDEATGQVVYETNVYGDYLWFIARVALGVLATQRRNAIPILHLRKRGI